MFVAENDGLAAEMTAGTGTASRKASTANKRRWRLCGLAVLFAGLAFLSWGYLTTPKGTEANGPVDALLVLGTPADIDGSLTDSQRWRVDEAVREYRAGVAGHILLSGGPAANRFVEAEVMAAYARRLGVPETALVEEGRSKTTLDNVRYSQSILDAHGWQHIEVISSAEHLHRAAVLLEHTHLHWRLHPAPMPGRPRFQSISATAEEAVGTTALRIFGLHAEPVLHGVATVQHLAAFGVRWIFYELRGLIERAVERSR